VFAAQVNGKYNSGDYAGAVESSRRARTFALLAFVLGLIANGIYLAIYFSNR
jgi:hypothetical protein